MSTATGAGFRRTRTGTVTPTRIDRRCGRAGYVTRSDWRRFPQLRRRSLSATWDRKARVRGAESRRTWLRSRLALLEGPQQTPQYRAHPFCRSYYEREDARAPWVAVRHPDGLSITGGVPLDSAAAWPSEYRSRYVFADWLKSEIYTVPLVSGDSPAVPRLSPAGCRPGRFRATSRWKPLLPRDQRGGAEADCARLERNSRVGRA